MQCQSVPVDGTVTDLNVLQLRADARKTGNACSWRPSPGAGTRGLRSRVCEEERPSLDICTSDSGTSNVSRMETLIKTNMAELE